MKKSRKPESFVKKPIYPGGNDAFKKFLQEYLRYPKEAIENKTEGVVRIKMDIDRDGNVIKTQVMLGIGFGCDEEACRVVALMKYKTDPPKKGHIIYHKTINIPFKLPKAKKASFNYTYTSNSNKDIKEESSEKSSYNYSIVIKK